MKLVYDTLLWTFLIFSYFIESSLQILDLNLPPEPENHAENVNNVPVNNPERDNNVPVNHQINSNVESGDVTNRIANRPYPNVQTRRHSQSADQNLSSGNENHQTNNNNVNAHHEIHNSPVNIQVQLLPRRMIGNEIGPLRGVLFINNQRVLNGRAVNHDSATNEEALHGIPVANVRLARRNRSGRRNSRLPENQN